jgi:NTE family protein
VAWRLIRRILLLLFVAAGAGCAAPLHRPPKPLQPAGPETPPRVALTAGRPTVGVAFGGGSARGLAHVGVIRWMQEHRIPIDLAAGTSMGGLVGGAFAMGMDADELQAFATSLDWDELFGSSTFAFKNIRRKADARAYPSRLEFGLKGGIVPPTALNTGAAVEQLLCRMAAPYFDLENFDALPTPFRAVAVDLLSAQPIVLRRGSLAEALRATMSLPFVFPPVEIDGRVLVDGGILNNVPADVVKAMGADRVVAIDVADPADPEGIPFTIFGVTDSTLDAMMRSATRRTLAAADIVVHVPLRPSQSYDWRRASDLIDAGYRAAEAMRAELLPLAVSQEDFDAWKRGRGARRRTTLPAPAYVDLEGFAEADTRRLDAVFARHLGRPLDVKAVEHDVAEVSGLDRYETVTWNVSRDAARGYGLHVKGHAKPYAPPFLMLGLNLENTTSSDFRLTGTARYLAFDVAGSGSELRLDGTLGSDPGAAAELYRPIDATRLFVAPYAGVGTRTLNVIDDDAVVARYRETRARVGVNVGVNVTRRSDVRIGAYIGRTTATIKVGDPGFPELDGKETGAELLWRLDTQDSPVVPSTGVVAQLRLSQVFDAPDVTFQEQTFQSAAPLTQLSASANGFWSLGPRNRLFLAGSLGTSFDDDPLPTSEFELGGPFRLSAYHPGELRGNHAYTFTAGYLRRVFRMPDFVGGPVFAGGWLDNGDAFDNWSRATWRANGSLGLVMDTLVGPAVVAASWSFDGRWRIYLGIGRLFR